MNYKCQYCDPTVKKGQKPIKSINIHESDFIKTTKGKYYHTDCYREFLTSKNCNSEEIESQIEKLKSIQASEIKEADEKDTFLKWIMNFYDGTLPTYYLKKLQSVRDGSHESVDDKGVTYLELLDIYQHMQTYLIKITMNKKFKTISQRMNYDLAVVIGNIGDYRNYKKKQESLREETSNLSQTVNRHKAAEKSKKQKSDEFDLIEDIDDLLL